MKVLITGTSRGIGRAAALKFLNMGHTVIGFDKEASSIEREGYTHFVCDITSKVLPEIEGVEILINNAGIQTDNVDDLYTDIDVNLKGTINVTEKYAIQSQIKSVVFSASASATTGAEFPGYVASKGGLLAYMKNVAMRIAPYGATSNSISAGGVITPLNDHILNDPELYRQVLAETMLGKWATAEEIAEFIYFIAVINRSMTGEDIFVDNGEALKSNCVW